MNIKNSIKLKWLYLRHGLNYSKNISEGIYKNYLNHNKVIHYRGGLPVYSLSIPPLFSNASARLISNLAFKIITERSFPILMSIAVGDQCNANCDHCSFYKGFKKGKLLNLQQIKNAIKQGQELGASTINIVGGEPLLNKNIFEIIKSIDKDSSISTIFTNGWHLSDQVHALKAAGLGGVYVSIDSADSGKHDKIRQKPGMFIRALKGIEKARQSGMTVGISCCIDEQDYESGELDKILDLSRGLKIHELLIFDKIPVGKLIKCRDKLRDNSWIRKVIKWTEKFNADTRYPGVLVYSHITSQLSVGCAAGRSFLYLSPYGDVCACDFDHNIFGNVKEKELSDIWIDMNQKIKESDNSVNCRLRF